MKNKKTKRNKKDTGSLKTYIFLSLKSLAVLVFLLLFSAFICYKVDAEHKLYFPVTIAVCVISGVLSGMLATSKINKKGIVCGLLGVLPSAVTMFVATMILSNFHFSIKIVIFLGSMILSGIFGGIIKANMRR